MYDLGGDQQGRGASSEQRMPPQIADRPALQRSFPRLQAITGHTTALNKPNMYV